MKGENLFNALWYSVIPLQLFGTCPISLRRDNKSCAYQVSVFGATYILVLIGFIAFCGHATIIQGINVIFKAGEIPVLILHYEIRAILGPCGAVLILIASILRAPNVCRFISDLAELSSVLPHHFSSLFYRLTISLSSTIIAIFLIFTFTECFIELDNVLMMSQGVLAIPYLVSFYLSWIGFDIVSWAAITQLLIYSGMLYYQFRALEIEVSGDSRRKFNTWWNLLKIHREINSNTGYPRNLKNLRHLYIHLSCVADDLNKIFATQILVCITLNTILLCFNCFILLLNLDQQANSISLKLSLFWLFIRIFPIYLIILPFCCIKNKVDQLTATIHLWITKVDDEKVLQELHLFANQLNQKQLSFSAHGFFCIKTSTITSIIGAAISYLMILIQFHSQSKVWDLDRTSMFSSFAPRNGSWDDFVNISDPFNHTLNDN